MNEKVNWMQQGWECPKCGAVMSPTTSCCVNCRGNKGGFVTTITVGDPLDTIYDIDKTKLDLEKAQQSIYDACGTPHIDSYPKDCYKVKSHVESAPDSFKYWENKND